MVVLCWFGTLLGALALALALSTASAAWTTHHQPLYVFLWVAVITCVVIAVGVPLLYGSRWARFRWMVWRAARRFAKKPPQVTMTAVVNPGSEIGSREFRFTTNKQRRMLITTRSRPAGLRITAPVEASVWAVPSAVQHYGKTIFTVGQFLPTGFVVEDQAPGLAIEGEVSYAELPKPSESGVEGPPGG
jgi:hypothetical protein